MEAWNNWNLTTQGCGETSRRQEEDRRLWSSLRGRRVIARIWCKKNPPATECTPRNTSRNIIINSIRETKIMTGNRLLLIQTAWWTAEVTSKDDESNDGGKHGGRRTPDRQWWNTHHRKTPHSPRRRRMMSRKLSSSPPLKNVKMHYVLENTIAWNQSLNVSRKESW